MRKVDEDRGKVNIIVPMFGRETPEELEIDEERIDDV